MEPDVHIGTLPISDIADIKTDVDARLRYLHTVLIKRKFSFLP